MEKEDRDSLAIILPEETGRDQILNDIDTYIEMPPPVDEDYEIDENEYVEFPNNDIQHFDNTRTVDVYEQMCRHFIAAMIEMGQKQVMRSHEAISLQRWEQKLIPVLEREDKKEKFNIENCGEWIKDVVRAHDKVYSFKALTQDLEIEEKSRIFLTLLVMVNARKIVLEGYQEGIENEDFLIRLLE
ncbi:condensin-2 complex subunit H2-like [Histomonas meleagridis]|nr:condensin-2 complex subunit H2-like [Histomonas meleagridis]